MQSREGRRLVQRLGVALTQLGTHEERQHQPTQDKRIAARLRCGGGHQLQIVHADGGRPVLEGKTVAPVEGEVSGGANVLRSQLVIAVGRFDGATIGSRG